MRVVSGNSSRMITTTGPSRSGTEMAPELAVAAVEEPAGRADEQERSDEQDVAHREVLQEHPARPGPVDQHHDRRAHHRGQRRGGVAVQVDPAHQHVAEDGAEQCQEDDVRRRRRAAMQERGDRGERDHHQRRHQPHHEGEGDDLARVVVPGHEELRVAAQQVEDRLGHRDPDQADEGGDAAPDGGPSGERRWWARDRSDPSCDEVEHRMVDVVGDLVGVDVVRAGLEVRTEHGAERPPLA